MAGACRAAGGDARLQRRMILLPDTPTTALASAALRRWILLFVITVGFMARMATFQAPLLDHHSWRQADGATIARNFYREGLSPLRPAIDAAAMPPTERWRPASSCTR